MLLEALPQGEEYLKYTQIMKGKSSRNGNIKEGLGPIAGVS